MSELEWVSEPPTDSGLYLVSWPDRRGPPWYGELEVMRSGRVMVTAGPCGDDAFRPAKAGSWYLGPLPALDFELVDADASMREARRETLRSISELPLRLVNALHSSRDVSTLGEVCELTWREIHALKNVGASSCAALANVLALRGLSLDGDPS